MRASRATIARAGARSSPRLRCLVHHGPFGTGSWPNGPGLTGGPRLDTAAGHGHPATCSACGQQGPAGRHERGRERLEQLLERGSAVGLAGHERAIDGREREARELVGDSAPRIVAERDSDLLPQEPSACSRIRRTTACISPSPAVGDLYDPRCAWLRHRQIASDGAVLVRPDRIIAWREPAAVADPRAALAGALSQVLARPAGRAASPARPRPLSQQPPSGRLAGVTHHLPAGP